MRQEQTTGRDTLTSAALALAVLLAAPALAQDTGMQRIWLSFDQTSQLGGLLVGQGVAEVASTSAGATTAGGTLSWTKYLDHTDNLGMRHVHYSQRFFHPQLGRQVRVLGAAVSLHFAPDGSLRWVNGAQLTDVATLPAAALGTAQQAFAAVQAGLASWPGFAPGNPAGWSPGRLQELLDHSELLLAPLQGGEGRLRWSVMTLDAAQEVWSVVVDAASAALVAVTPTNPAACWQRPSCADCNAMSPQDDVVARGLPESEELTAKNCGPNHNQYCYCGHPGYGCDTNGLRDIYANPCPPCVYPQTCNSTCEYYRYLSNPPVSCGGVDCTYEAARAADAGVPQIEVDFGSNNYDAYLKCGEPEYGQYMRLGLKVVNGFPYYGPYVGGKQIPGEELPHAKHRQFAGDAMYYTLGTMETLRDSFDWHFPDVARVVVDAQGTTGGAWFEYLTDGLAPTDGLRFDPPTGGNHSMSAALDIVAHEWAHYITKYGPADFAGMCFADVGVPDTCEMTEGFADVVGHFVERTVQTNDDNGNYLPEHRDWTAGEDWDPDDSSHALRRADAYDNDQPPLPHASIHVLDPPWDGPGATIHSHSGGNRLAVVFRLLAEGGTNPACSRWSNCDINVDGIGLDRAAQILFRTVTEYSNSSTTDWDDLPHLALHAAYDTYHLEQPPCAVAIQTSVRDAFKAVGYPEDSPAPYLLCDLPCPVCYEQ